MRPKVVGVHGLQQYRPAFVAYNQAAGRLETLRRAWEAQPETKRNYNRLVDDCESVLSTELSGWVQQMNQAIEEAARSGRDREPANTDPTPTEAKTEPAPTEHKTRAE